MLCGSWPCVCTVCRKSFFNLFYCPLYGGCSLHGQQQTSRVHPTHAQDPDASNEDTDEVLTRQFTAFGDALGDECPAVRAEAVTGLAGLLDTFWELVPAAATAGFLQRIAGRSKSTLTREICWVCTSMQ